MLKNTYKSWVTSVLGAALVLGTGAVGLGFVEVKTDVSQMTLWVFGAVGLGLILAPDTLVAGLKNLIKKKSE